MQATSSGFKTVIAGNDVPVVARVRLTLPIPEYSDVTVAVESIKVDRELTTDMPEGTRLVAGYPAASATVVLSGLVDRTDETKSIAWLLNPFQTDSPMFRLDATGSDVVIEAGVRVQGAKEMQTVFTGSIDSMLFDPETGKATLTCIDRRNRLRAPVNIPCATSISITAFVTGVGVPGIRYIWAPQMLTALWPLHFIFAANGYHTNPPPRPGCILYASCAGSMFPEVGGSPSSSQGPMPDGSVPDPVPGFWSVQVPGVAPLDGAVNVSSSADTSVSMRTGMTIYCEGWVNIPAEPTSADYAEAVIGWRMSSRLNANFGDYWWVDLRGPASALKMVGAFGRGSSPTTSTTQTDWNTTTKATTAGWHRIGFATTYTSATTAQISWWIDGVLQQTGGLTVTAAVGSSEWNTSTNAYIEAYVPVDTVQMTTEAAPDPASAFTPNCFLDASLNNLTAIPDVTGLDGWGVLQQITQAECGVVGFDEYGIPRFQNRASLHQSSASRVVSAKSSLKRTQVSLDSSMVRTQVTVPINVLQVQNPSVVWSASETYSVAGNGTFSMLITTENPVAKLSNASLNIGFIPVGGPNFNNPLSVLTGYRGCKAVNGVGPAVNNLSFSCSQVAPTTLRIEVKNPNPYRVYLVNPSGYPSAPGTPSIVVSGQFVTATAIVPDSTVGETTSSGRSVRAQWPPAAEGGAAANPRGVVELALEPNLWMQNPGTGTTLANDLLEDLYEPRPVFQSIEVVADSSLQLVDRLTLDAKSTANIYDDLIVTGLSLSVSKSQFSQSISGRSIGKPGGWIMGQPGRSEMGVSTYV